MEWTCCSYRSCSCCSRSGNGGWCIVAIVGKIGSSGGEEKGVYIFVVVVIVVVISVHDLVQVVLERDVVHIVATTADDAIVGEDGVRVAIIGVIVVVHK